jgi:hypothetical protein
MLKSLEIVRGAAPDMLVLADGDHRLLQRDERAAHLPRLWPRRCRRNKPRGRPVTAADSCLEIRLLPKRPNS